MTKYNKLFREYLDNVAKRQPSPGGGSVIALMFCQGVSLIEKALNYSCSPGSGALTAKDRKIRESLLFLRRLRKKIYPIIDKDGEIFKKVISHKGARRRYYIKKSESLIEEIASASLEAFSIAKSREPDIKKSISSDFKIGKECLRLVLAGSLKNLEANAEIFGVKNKLMARLKGKLSKWR
jgi:formiminotetrahydrofolate cyclodeaminase